MKRKKAILQMKLCLRRSSCSSKRLKKLRNTPESTRNKKQSQKLTKNCLLHSSHTLLQQLQM